MLLLIDSVFQDIIADVIAYSWELTVSSGSAPVFPTPVCMEEHVYKIIMTITATAEDNTLVRGEVHLDGSNHMNYTFQAIMRA